MAITDKTREGFERLLREFHAQRIPIPISNKYPWQTRLAIRELLGLARETKAQVRLLTGTGTDMAYGRDDLAKPMRLALEEGCHVRILVWNDAQHPVGSVLAQLAKDFPAGLEIKMSGTRLASDKIPHFLTVGEDANRLEIPHPPYDNIEFTEDSPETRASICFNAAEGTRGLNTYFDVLWAKCPLFTEG